MSWEKRYWEEFGAHYHTWDALQEAETVNDWGLIKRETGIDNPETVVKLLNEWLMIKQWFQEPRTPDHLYHSLKDLFKAKKEW